MTPERRLSQEAFDELIREHQHLILLANELELQAYSLGDTDTPATTDRVIECQKAAGRLIEQLRQALFRLDQQVYPLLDPRLP
jgi:hypothetical protein